MDEVVHKQGKRKFVIERDGLKASLRYKIRKNNVMDILHTEVPETWRGKWVGKKLVDAAMKFAEQENYSIKPSCSFVRKVMDFTPDSNEKDLK